MPRPDSLGKCYGSVIIYTGARIGFTRAVLVLQTDGVQYYTVVKLGHSVKINQQGFEMWV